MQRLTSTLNLEDKTKDLRRKQHEFSEILVRDELKNIRDHEDIKEVPNKTLKSNKTIFKTQMNSTTESS